MYCPNLAAWQDETTNLGRMDPLPWTKIDGGMNSQKCALEVTKLDDHDLFGKNNFQDENYYLNFKKI